MKNKKIKNLDRQLELAFIEYLENALVAFEEPHSIKSTEDRIAIYLDAFKKAVKSFIKKLDE